MLWYPAKLSRRPKGPCFRNSSLSSVYDHTPRTPTPNFPRRTDTSDRDGTSPKHMSSCSSSHTRPAHWPCSSPRWSAGYACSVSAMRGWSSLSAASDDGDGCCNGDGGEDDVARARSPRGSNTFPREGEPMQYRFRELNLLITSMQAE
ncbi:hypothetical protein VTK56DRAFT_3431 [Thermocarpiscus australiensis]